MSRRSKNSIQHADFHPTTVDVLGSGPAPIVSRENPAESHDYRPGSHRIALRQGMDDGIAESLLRYVNEFGQGKGTALVEDGAILLEFQFRDDRDLLKRQFSNLFECSEADRGRGL